VFNLLDTYGLLSSIGPSYKYSMSVFIQSLVVVVVVVVAAAAAVVVTVNL